MCNFKRISLSLIFISAAFSMSLNSAEEECRTCSKDQSFQSRTVPQEVADEISKNREGEPAFSSDIIQENDEQNSAKNTASFLPSSLPKEQFKNATARAHCLASVHLVRAFLADNIIQLEDGSQWSYDSSKAHKLRFWQLDDRIILSPKTTWIFKSNYAYVLTNFTEGSSIEVNPLIAPDPDNRYTQFVIGLNPQMGHVYLMNGFNEKSTWIIAEKDRALLDYFYIGDMIIVGEVNKLFTTYDFILISVPLNQYVHAKILN